MKPARRVLVLVVTVAAALSAPAAAQALTVSGTGAPADLQAGANEDFQIQVNFGPDTENVKDLTIGLPPGQVGNPLATPKCTVDQLNANSCPANTQVGTTSANATVTLVAVPVPLTVNGKVFNLEPQPGEPARFGIVLTPVEIPEPLSTAVGGALPPVILQSGAELRPDYGLNAVVEDIPQTTPTPLGDLPTHISAMTMTLFGMAGDPAQPFMRTPTSCTEKTVAFTANSHTNDTPVTAQAPSFTPTGCDALDFSPSFTALLGAPGLTASGAKTPAVTAIDQDPGEAGLERAQVLIPTDVGASSEQLNETCTLEQFEGGACPANSVIGSAVATSPLLTEPLTGPVALIGTDTGVPRIGLDLRGPLPLQLFGDFVFTGSTSGIVFDGLPDIPIAHFELSFVGGPDGLLVAGRDLCQPPGPVFNTTFDSHSGAAQSGDTAAAIDGCGAASLSPDKGKKKGKPKCKKRKKKRATKKKCRKKKKKKKR